ncbi:hypothetical protein VP01_8799g1, partial [Puccinia sorghi]
SLILQPELIFQSSVVCNNKMKISVMAPNNCISIKIYVNYLFQIGRVKNQFCKGMGRGVRIIFYWLYKEHSQTIYH